MEKRYAFLLALLVTLLVAGNYLFLNASNIFPERETVIIGRVIDGDTVELEDGRKIRLLNINAPEKGKPFSEDSTNFLKSFENKSVELEFEGVDKYGRVLGRIYSGEYINLELVRLGLAHQYLGEDSEIADFKKAEKEARAKEVGIWEKSVYYDCLNVEINKYDEYVIIEDKCDVEFGGWTLKDESTKDYSFKEIRGSRFVIYSESGIDKNDEFYWGRDKVWNDDKDSIFIRDEEGNLVYYDSYGY